VLIEVKAVKVVIVAIVGFRAMKRGVTPPKPVPELVLKDIGVFIPEPL
jgi:hypothetical protein